jgi:chromosome segregation ATPase
VLAEVTERCERAETSFAEVSAKADAVATRDQHNELELSRLREECTGLRGTLADRETALVQAGLAIEQARERWQREAQEALSKAETGWKAGEAARLAAAEAQWHAAQTQWREQSASALAEVTERCERAETSFAEVSAKADAVATRDQHNEIELRRLREVCAALRAILADRETALAEAGLAIEQAREQWQREAHEALSKAETGWKAGEAARLAAAQTQWQEQSASALAEVTARCQRAETSLAEVSAKADAVAARDPDNEIELRRMREECTGLRAILADREAALAQGGLAIEQARERWQRETQEALSKAETGWKAEEAARLATAEAQWRKQSASALAEMTVRCKRAETSLVEANARADSIVKRDQSNKAEFRRLREELAKTQAALADREVELACARSATDQSRESQTPGTDIVLKPNRIGSIRAIEHREKKASRHLVRDMAVAASLAIATVVLYPYIEPSFPEIGTSSSGPAPAGSSASSAQSPQRAGQRMAVVIHAGNVRAGPSTGAAIVSTLQRGLKVATVEQRGNWTLVRIEDETGDTKPQQGWVYSSFLDAGGSDQESPTAKRK